MKTLQRLLVTLLLSFSLWGSTAAIAQTITYFHNDISGSPLAATDEAGEVLWKEQYSPYGDKIERALAANSNRIGYHGQSHDDHSGLSYMGARYYDPVLGRFMGIDPVGFVETNLHSANRYAYANNNPYKFVDPDGQFALPVVYYAILFVGAIITANQFSAPHGRSGSPENSVPGFSSEPLTKPWGPIFNEEAKGGDGGDKGGQKDVTKRPSRVRKGTEQGNWENAEEGESGGKVCPTCGNEVNSRPGQKNKDWDNDHNPPWRDRDLSGKDRKGVLDEYNRDTRLRCVSCNRSDNGSR